MSNKNTIQVRLYPNEDTNVVLTQGWPVRDESAGVEVHHVEEEVTVHLSINDDGTLSVEVWDTVPDGQGGANLDKELASVVLDLDALKMNDESVKLLVS